MQQLGHAPQHVVPQQPAGQHDLQHVGHLSQHTVPQQVAVAGLLAGRGLVPPKAEAANRIALRNREFIGLPFSVTGARVAHP